MSSMKYVRWKAGSGINSAALFSFTAKGFPSVWLLYDPVKLTDQRQCGPRLNLESVYCYPPLTVGGALQASLLI